MKSFKDLRFEQKEDINGTQAVMEFDNGYGVSVITGYGSYTSEGKPYELAVLHNGSLCYSTNITNDVLGHQTPNEIDVIMEKIQKL